jgi:hypothetical protein
MLRPVSQQTMNTVGPPHPLPYTEAMAHRMTWFCSALRLTEISATTIFHASFVFITTSKDEQESNQRQS